MLYKFQSVWNKNSKWLLTRARYKMCKWKGTKNLITVKTVLKCRTLKGRKGIVNGWEAKAKVQTTTEEIEEVQKVEVKKKAKGK